MQSQAPSKPLALFRQMFIIKGVFGLTYYLKSFLTSFLIQHIFIIIYLKILCRWCWPKSKNEPAWPRRFTTATVVASYDGFEAVVPILNMELLNTFTCIFKELPSSTDLLTASIFCICGTNVQKVVGTKIKYHQISYFSKSVHL